MVCSKKVEKVYQEDGYCVQQHICRFGNIEEESPPKPISNVFANNSTTRWEPLPPPDMRCCKGAGERLCGGAVTLTDDIQQAQLIDANKEIGGKGVVLGKKRNCRKERKFKKENCGKS